MIRATIQGQRLKLTADNEGRNDIAAALQRPHRWKAQTIIADALHEQWEFICPEEVGGLTDAPILAEAADITRDDNGDLLTVGRVAWFPDYMVRDPWRELANRGHVYFDLARDDQ